MTSDRSLPWPTFIGSLILLSVVPFWTPSPLVAQQDPPTVSGTLVAAGTGEPVEGAFVTLRDSAGRRAAGAMSASGGSFVLEAPGPGRYRLRVQRIGFDTWTGDGFRLATGEHRGRRLQIPVRPVKVENLTVETERRCRTSRSSATRGFRLWNEARKALHTASWLVERYHFAVREYRRRLGPETGEPKEKGSWSRSGVRREPFQSVATSRLVGHGFVERARDTLVYRAPDADVLLSERFARTHCFAIDRDSAGRVGVRFRPLPGRNTPDIQGVLWFRRDPFGLDRLDFEWVNLPIGISREGAEFGGRIVFDRTLAGAWFVRRWRLRMPEIGARIRYRSPMLRGRRMIRDSVLVAVVERGGVVQALRPASSSVAHGNLPFRQEVALPAPPSLAVAPDGSDSGETGIVGRVTGRDSDRPIEAMEVVELSSGRRAVTGPEGRFVLDSVVGGVRRLRLHHVGYGTDTVTVEVPDGQTLSLTLSLRPRPVKVEPLSVRVEEREVRLDYLEDYGFYRRRARGWGEFWGPEEIRDWPGVRITQFLQRTRRVQMVRDPITRRRIIPMMRALPGCGPPLAVVDGHRWGNTFADWRDLYRSLPATGVAAIEVYRNPAETAPEYVSSRSRCGVVVFWTRRGPG